MKKLTSLLLAGALLAGAYTADAQTKKTTAAKGQRWSVEKAKAWYAQQPWIAGANFTPSSAINQLEMWQADTFDPTTIDRELGYAEGIGFNAMRVFLHSLAYEADPKGFKTRVSKYLEIADKHKIKTMFVFFDDCWNEDPKIGKQPEVKIGVHNSGWVMDPGVPAMKDPKTMPRLEKYVKDVLTTFAHDKRVLLWDLYNEPGNKGKRETSLPLVKSVFGWAREVNPDQPLSVGIWDLSFEKLNAYQVLNSDIVTYHNYDDAPVHEAEVRTLKTHDRPLICTEYMARTRKSLFSNVMPMLKKENVGAINWGFVAGKTNTIFAWDTPMPNGGEPLIWFHDIFRKDGSPYKAEETDVIKKTTGR
ncbi:cellulase family glycosylhydrolase [Mucilaginibacter myungsuensis]|uniref:Cellulase family glycosylhydrolase n=1 Tax=Mucilaginibacter myungsuensis TaxID=649104 RepID=A0A929PVN7_9SPHI|nr:cellulase family glycosylhydrolase [Mucilaginibacter myungsuensis]MBE9661968.1 cellulase family glycosylhydrolase [Mucilaginibacter myungsuensis]MDN3599599.1 cellulase family glycosylhydrolase [Mucilaginibacter myungsuensis]